MIEIMYKFGKKEHLQKIIDGVIRFKSAQYYIDLEKFSYKGIADNCDSGINLATWHSTILLEGQEIGTVKNLKMRPRGVASRPIFCCSYINQRNVQLVRKNGGKAVYRFHLDDKWKAKMENDCCESQYDSVLVMHGGAFLSNIIESQQGITDVNHQGISYEETNKIAFQLLSKIHDDENQKNELSFIKDVHFEYQMEYRIVLTDININSDDEYFVHCNSINDNCATIFDVKSFFHPTTKLEFEVDL